MDAWAALPGTRQNDVAVIPRACRVAGSSGSWPKSSGIQQMRMGSSSGSVFPSHSRPTR
ncbi:MAG TPA: hypothetical protein VFZ20_05860 [Longimicrobium sp.]|nr:hypothetical protein [Longimicrobium sp.]HEX6037539.1 hypothetical protein [Longimicrobium sp.]